MQSRKISQKQKITNDPFVHCKKLINQRTCPFFAQTLAYRGGNDKTSNRRALRLETTLQRSRETKHLHEDVMHHCEKLLMLLLSDLSEDT